MKNNTDKHYDAKLAAAIIFLAMTLLAGAWFYQNYLEEKLWSEEVASVTESTSQAAKVLQTNLGETYRTLKSLSDIVAAARDEEELQAASDMVNRYPGFTFYTSDWFDRYTGANQRADVEAVEAMRRSPKPLGIVNPHDSTVTGERVFNVYATVSLFDNREAFVAREVSVNAVADDYSIPLYKGRGALYVVDDAGEILLRSTSSATNRTAHSLYDGLGEKAAEQALVEKFRDAVARGHSGWSLLTQNHRLTVFVYQPVRMQTDWHIVAQVPMSVMQAESREIASVTFLLLAAALLIFGVVVLVFAYVNRGHMERLRAQSAYSDYLFNTVPEGLLVVGLERPFTTSEANFEAGLILDAGNDVEKMDVEKLVHPEDYPNVELLMMDTAEHGIRHSGECRVTTKAGRLIWVSYILDKARDAEGEERLLVTFRDVTGRRQREARIAAENQEDRELLLTAIAESYPLICRVDFAENTVSTVYLQDEDILLGRTMEDTPEGFFKDTLKDVIEEDRHVVEMFDPENIRRVLASGGRFAPVEFRLKFPDGKYHWLSVHLVPLGGGEQAVLLVRFVDAEKARDEETLRRISQALEMAQQANRAKTLFLANMSHDIRTPMNAIIGMTAITKKALDDPERARAGLAKIEFASQHLLSLINDILDMSKIESGKVTLKSESFDIAELLTDVTDLVKTNATAADLKVTLDLSGITHDWVVSDSLRVRQIYFNILSNAVKYTPAGGTVAMKLEEVAGQSGKAPRFVFTCRDTGIGMTPEFKAKIFDAFERADNTMTSTKVTGTGLGMTIVKNLTEMFGGEITIDTAPEKGSTFRVTLPLPLSGDGILPAPKRFGRVVAEVSTAESVRAAVLLAAQGVVVETTTDIEESLETLHEAGSLILACRPGAADCIARLRAAHPALVIVAVTDVPESALAAAAKKAGAVVVAEPLCRARLDHLIEGSSAPGALEAGKGAHADFKDCRALVVEDNALNREIAVAILEEEGMVVETAENGAAGVAKVKASEGAPYDFVLMDIQMPVMNGYDAARAIRAIGTDYAKRLPVIAMTANAFAEDVEEAIAAGMNAHCAKPIEIEKLLLTVEKAMRQTRQDREAPH